MALSLPTYSTKVATNALSTFYICVETFPQFHFSCRIWQPRRIIKLLLEASGFSLLKPLLYEMHLAVERQNNYDKPPLTWDLLLVALMIKIIHLLMTFATLITFTQFTFLSIPRQQSKNYLSLSIVFGVKIQIVDIYWCMILRLIIDMVMPRSVKDLRQFTAAIHVFFSIILASALESSSQ